jgi:hypothetical protein
MQPEVKGETAVGEVEIPPVRPRGIAARDAQAHHGPVGGEIAGIARVDFELLGDLRRDAAELRPHRGQPLQVDAGRQQLTIIDPRTRVLGIYHVDTQSGAITLKSVRNISWDLQMVEFNGTNPLPRDVRALLEPR